jgi:uncharacterized protein YbjT (DUF2867 family)
VILLTGATGNIGSALLARLTEKGERVRVLVRDTRKLGPERVRVQITLGDLSDPGSFRNALRGVDTVIHLAAAIRDQPRASIEELNSVATVRLVRAARRAGVERFLFFSAMGATLNSRSRFFRAKALAEQAVEESGVDHLIFLPSIVYSPGDAWTKLLHTLSYLPAMPISGSGRARYQPIATDDAADAVMATLDGKKDIPKRIELAGPENLSYDDIARESLRAFGRRRRLLHVPLPIVKASLETLHLFAGEGAFATWEEAELMEISMTTPRGPADVEALGVEPRPMREVLAG